MPRQSISLTDPNADWIRAQIDSKEYISMSDAVNDLIRQARRKEKQEIDQIRAMLIEAEESIKKYGYSKRTVNEIWEEAKQKHMAQNGQV